MKNRREKIAKIIIVLQNEAEEQEQQGEAFGDGTYFDDELGWEE